MCIMSLLQFNESESSEVRQIISCFVIDSTRFFESKFDFPRSHSMKSELKRIRSENPNLYKALSLDKFD